MALIVSHSISPSPMPNASSSAANSLDIDTPLMSRLSVLTVTRKRSRRRRSIGWSATDAAAPVWTFDVGHISSGTRRSRTNAASRPSSTEPSARTVMSSTIRTPCPSRSAPAELERLPDRRQPERLAGVDRDVEVLAADVVEGVEIAGRAVALLRAGDVEPDHAGVAPADRAFRDLDRAGGLAHRRHEHLHDDRLAGGSGPLRADP